MNSLPAKMSASCFTAVIAALFLVGCDQSTQQASWWHGENERISLDQELELKKFRFEQVYAGDVLGLEKLQIANKRDASRLSELSSRRMTLSREVESMESQWDEFRQETVGEHRRAMTGRTFDEFSVVSGRIFKDVRVMAINDAGVTIRHADGSARLRYSDLNASQQQQFGLEPDLAMVAENAEQRQAVAYEQLLEKQMIAVREEEFRNKEIAMREDRETDRRAERARSAAAARNLVVSNARPLAQPARSFGNSSTYWGGNYYSSYRYCRPAYSNYSSCYPRTNYRTSPKAYPWQVGRTTYTPPNRVVPQK